MLAGIAITTYLIGWVVTFVRASRAWHRKAWEQRHEDPLWTATKWPAEVITLLFIVFVVLYLWLDELLAREGV